MTNEAVTYIALGTFLLILLLIVAISVVIKRKPKKLNQAYYQEEWQNVQGLLKNKETWPLAIINADKLLDNALKRRKYRGNTMGERLVAAQKDLSQNDSIWFAHKLRNRLVHDQPTNLRDKDVKAALVGFRQALRDIGAL